MKTLLLSLLLTLALPACSAPSAAPETPTAEVPEAPAVERPDNVLAYAESEGDEVWLYTAEGDDNNTCASLGASNAGFEFGEASLRSEGAEVTPGCWTIELSEDQTEVYVYVKWESSEQPSLYNVEAFEPGPAAYR